MPTNDPIAPHSAPISAYMSVHSATNLAYVRYFAGKDNATEATFKSLNARGFEVEYTVDGQKDVAFIAFKEPLSKREEIRPTLEAMAKEAETALGLPSSLTGPPPLKAIAKALYAQASRPTTLYEEHVDDQFIAADMGWQVAIAAGMGTTALLAYADNATLPSLLLALRDGLGQQTIRYIWYGACTAHVAEAVVALRICLHRGCYSPSNIFRWTLSTALFGYASMTKLLNHRHHHPKSA